MITQYPLIIFGRTFKVPLKTFLIGTGAKVLFAITILVGCLIGLYQFGNEYLNGSGTILVILYFILFFQFKNNDKEYGLLPQNSVVRKFSWILSYSFFIYAVL